MDFTTIAADVAKFFNLDPSTLLMLIFIITTAANAGSRLIPNDATGTLAVIRKICSFVGVHISSRVTRGITEADVSAAAVATPPIDQKAQAIAASE